MRTRIKICGITNAEDAQAAVEAGADMLGIIRVPNTPRFVPGWEASYCEARNAIMQAVWGRSVKLVGVYKDVFDADTDSAPFDLIQAYADTTPYSRLIDMPHYIRAFRVRDATSLEEIAEEEKRASRGVTLALLLDTYHKDKLGGAGETFNWELAVEAKARFGLPIILAGGLTPENVGEAIRKVRPYAVDVSSGVEAEPGRKDHAKVRAFVAAVRAADGAD